MALEGERKRGRKKVKLPDGQTLFIPVITEINFLDPTDRAQETRYTINNNQVDKPGDRTIHTDDVHPSTNGVQDSSLTLKVERIDQWPVTDASDRGQETRITLDNVTGNDLIPPSFTTHQKTHIYRYTKDPQNPKDQVWIESELIDEFSVIDGSDRAQETRAVLLNPAADDLAGQANPDDPDVTEYDDNGDPVVPLRTDPFQNIVNFRGQVIGVAWRFEVIPLGSGNVPGCGNSGAAQFATPAGAAVVCAYTVSESFMLGVGSPSGFPAGFTYTATPSVPTVTFTPAAVADASFAAAPSPWLLPIEQGGVPISFEGTTSVSGSAMLYYGVVHSEGTGYYGHVLGGPGGLFGIGYADSAALVPVGTVSASLSASTGTLDGNPWHCTRTGISFNPAGLSAGAASVTMAAWFEPGA